MSKISLENEKSPSRFCAETDAHHHGDAPTTTSLGPVRWVKGRQDGVAGGDYQLVEMCAIFVTHRFCWDQAVNYVNLDFIMRARAAEANILNIDIHYLLR